MSTPKLRNKTFGCISKDVVINKNIVNLYFLIKKSSKNKVKDRDDKKYF